MSSARLARNGSVLVTALAIACASIAAFSTHPSISWESRPSSPEAPPRRITFETLESTLSPDAFADLESASKNPTVDLDRAGILAEGAQGSGEVTLTFDDGPGVGTTVEVLRILEAHHVKGTFFLNGSRLAGVGVVAELHRRVAQSLVAKGHFIGNHGLDHLALDGDDVPFLEGQIDRSALLIAQATGEMPRWFRPPYGTLSPAARSVLAARHDELVLWTIDAQDTLEDDPERLAHRLEQQLLFAGQGVILLHDLRGSSARALSILLDWLDRHPRDAERHRGFSVVDLPTYYAHAAQDPFPEANRLALLRLRERLHRSGKL